MTGPPATGSPPPDPASMVVADLDPVEVANPFPFTAAPPVVCCGAGEILLGFGLDSGRGCVRMAVLDSRGRPVSEPYDLPLRHVAAACWCAQEAIVTGAGAGSGGATVLAATPKGVVRWQATLPPVGGELASWPQPLCLGGTAMMVWATKPATVHVAEASPEPRLIGSVDLPDSTLALAAEAAGSGITLARAAGDPARLELFRLEDGRLTEQRTLSGVRAVSPAIHWLGERYLVVWISPADADLRAQPFDGQLDPCGPATALVSAPEAKGMRLFASSGGRLALGWRTMARDHAARFTLAQFVAALDPARTQVGAHRPLAEPGTAYDAGGWADENLVVLHGRTTPLVSAFRRVERPPTPEPPAGLSGAASSEQ